MRLNEASGLWCPDVMTGPHAYIRRSLSLDAQVALLPPERRRTCVQAGGHVGVYPRALAHMFARVMTFEPEQENYECLRLNTATYENIQAYRAFLGPDTRHRRLRRHSKSSGGHQTGSVVPLFRFEGLRTMCVDALGLEDLDALFLDVEGFEGEVLKGARTTIKRCRPLVVAEENGKGPRYGWPDGSLLRWLGPLGYRVAAREGEDVVFQWAPP